MAFGRKKVFIKMIPSRKRVAILLAAYNGSVFIEEQIESILFQDGVDAHIFISVDLSSDDSYDYCCDLSDQHQNITILPYGERFGGAAKNFYRLIRDVDLSAIDYVALADQDDIWNADKLQRAVQKIEKHDIGAYSSDVMAFWEDGRRQLLKKSYPQVKYDYLFESSGPGCTFVFKKDVMQAFKDFMVEHVSEVEQVESHDWLIYAFCRSRAIPWLIDDYPSMDYRQHASNQVGINSGLKAFSKRITMVRKKWYRSEVVKISSLLEQEVATFKLNDSFLIFNFWQLRRRLRDKFALLVMLVLKIF